MVPSWYLNVRELVELNIALRPFSKSPAQNEYFIGQMSSREARFYVRLPV